MNRGSLLSELGLKGLKDLLDSEIQGKSTLFRSLPLLPSLFLRFFLSR
jgi:hypothetical protein